MKNLSSRADQYAFIHLGDGFKRFFPGLGKYRKFKRKGRDYSLTLDNCGQPIEINGWSHKLSFIGRVETYIFLFSKFPK